MRDVFLAVAAFLAMVSLAVAQTTTPTPGTQVNGQAASGSATGSSASGAATGAGSGFAPSSVEVLCLPAGAEVTQPFFLGTDLSCVP
jgi:hypothetical protein